MKISKRSLIILSLLSLPYFFGGTVFGFSTHSTTTSISRNFDKVQAIETESIMVTISFKNTGTIGIRGFYYADQIPEGLTISTVSVKVNGSDISNYIEESGSIGDVYDGTFPYRWIFELPKTFEVK